jgi:3-deoxy-manno-octulosonate cytidylyltransferase (CMP-KDO synthetase)
MKAIVIPARLESTRLPRKLLSMVHNMPIIEHTVRAALNCACDKIFVNTDSEDIHSAVAKFKSDRFQIIKTEEATSGTDRVCQMHKMLHDRGYTKVINWQADEPTIYPYAIRDLFNALDSMRIVTLGAPEFVADCDADSPHNVKVVRWGHKALYFSRAPIPYNGQKIIHLGVYAFQVPMLPLIQNSMRLKGHFESENLEQLAWLAAGFDIGVLCYEGKCLSINTTDDLINFHQWLNERTKAQI